MLFATLYRLTTVLFKASLGFEQYHSMNSRMLISALELADVRLFRTADFDCSRSGSLRTSLELVYVCFSPW